MTSKINRVPQRPIELYHGRHKRLNVTVKNENDNIQDVTGATVDYVIARKEGGTALVTKTGTIIDGPKGQIRIDILDTDTDGLPNKTQEYWHECVLTDASLRESPIFVGKVDFKASTVST